MDNVLPFGNKIMEVGMVASHEPKKYYRFFDGFYEDRIPLMEEFYSIKKTPKGIWIVPDWDFQLSYDKKEFYYTGEYKKFILDKAMKKHAHDNLEDALISYIKRKEKQRVLLEAKLFKVNGILACIKCENGKEYDLDRVIEKTKERYWPTGGNNEKQNSILSTLLFGEQHE